MWSQELAVGAWSGYDRVAGKMLCLSPAGPGTLRTVPWELPKVAGFRSGSPWQRLSPERYLVRMHVPKGGPAAGPVWRLADTVAGTEVAAPGLDADDSVVAVLDATRVLVMRREGGTDRPTHLRAVSLENGESRAVDVPPGVPAHLGEAWPCARLPDGRLVISVSGRGGDDRRGWILLDPDAAAVVGWAAGAIRTPWGQHLVACPDDDSLIVLEQGRRLVRLRWGTATRETLFPRPGR
jgi:hypothetical protein